MSTDLSSYDFAPVIRHDGDWHLFDLTTRYDPEFIKEKCWGIGRYNEKRKAMYNAPQYEGRRNIHMGVDLWAPAGEPVHAFYSGEVAYLRDNRQRGNYGPTVVTRHRLSDRTLYALHGHLSRASLERLEEGRKLNKGEPFAELGDYGENGGWVPHLHFQVSFDDPGEADMPGVVAPEEREEALEKYPDPRLVLGDIY